MKKLNAIINYDNDMDPEVINICNALNSLPGIKTSESCSGHNKEGIRIWFTVTDFVGLFFLSRCINNRYWKFGNSWNITLDVGDRMKDNILPTYFVLRSSDVKGKKAYKQLSDLIGNMNYHLNHNNFITGYKINVKKFKYINL